MKTSMRFWIAMVVVLVCLGGIERAGADQGELQLTLGPMYSTIPGESLTGVGGEIMLRYRLAGDRLFLHAVGDIARQWPKEGEDQVDLLGTVRFGGGYFMLPSEGQMMPYASADFGMAFPVGLDLPVAFTASVQFGFDFYLTSTMTAGLAVGAGVFLGEDTLDQPIYARALIKFGFML